MDHSSLSSYTTISKVLYIWQSRSSPLPSIRPPIIATLLSTEQSKTSLNPRHPLSTVKSIEIILFEGAIYLFVFLSQILTSPGGVFRVTVSRYRVQASKQASQPESLHTSTHHSLHGRQTKPSFGSFPGSHLSSNTAQMRILLLPVVRGRNSAAMARFGGGKRSKETLNNDVFAFPPHLGLLNIQVSLLK